MKTTKSQSSPRKSAGRSSGSNSSSSKSSTRSTSSRKSSETSLEDTFRELFEAELKDIYWAEKALTKAIPKMIKNATDENLIAALEDHLAVTESQVSRVEEVFDIMGMEASAKKCEAMSGLIKEAEEIMGDTEEGPVRDAGIIAAAQKVEHYEIATYGTLRTWATILGNDEATTMLQEILDEEKDADQTLTGVAESVNIKAESETDGDDMDGGSNGKSDSE
ncbi:MAG: ferritin-like domain-containing protein [Chitinophagales bacterium]